MKNIVISKQLNKIAEILVADDDCSKIVSNANFNGFTRRIEDDMIIFVYDEDETQGCYISFETENNSYTVYVDNDPIKEVTKNTCEEAFEDLKSNLNTYITLFKTSLEQNQDFEQQEVYENLGKYKLGRSKNNPNLIRITFTPTSNNDILIESSIENIMEDFENNMSQVQRNKKDKYQMFVVIMNPSDVNYIKGTLNYFGWEK